MSAVQWNTGTGIANQRKVGLVLQLNVKALFSGQQYEPRLRCWGSARADGSSGGDNHHALCWTTCGTVW